MNFWRKLWGGTAGAGQPVEDDFDPALLLERAQREMQEMHARNRERAVQAITQKNGLAQMVSDLESKLATIRERAETAASRGNPALAERLREEADSCETTLESTRRSLDQAVQATEHIKVAIRREEERIRKKAAEAMLLKAQWNTMQVQRSLFASLVEINTGSVRDIPIADRAVRHVMNRRFVEKAMAQRDNLRQMEADAKQRVETLRGNAREARSRENDDLENALLREMEQYEAILAQARAAAHQADDISGRAMSLLRSEEESLRAGGFDPRTVSDEQIELYEARAALAEAEGSRDARRAERRGNLAVIALVVFALAIALAALFL